MMFFGLSRLRHYKLTAAASYANDTTTATDILSQSFTTKGGGVFLSLVYNSGSAFPVFFTTLGGGTPGGFTIEFCRDDVVFHACKVYWGKTEASGSYVYNPTEFWAIDRAVGGTYVYKVRAKVSSAGETIEVNSKLLVAEGML